MMILIKQFIYDAICNSNLNLRAKEVFLRDSDEFVIKQVEYAVSRVGIRTSIYKYTASLGFQYADYSILAETCDMLHDIFSNDNINNQYIANCSIVSIKTLYEHKASLWKCNIFLHIEVRNSVS